MSRSFVQKLGCGALFVSALTLASCGTQSDKNIDSAHSAEIGSSTETFVSKSKTLGTNIYLFSTNAQNSENVSASRCYYFLESEKELSSEELKADSRVKLQNEFAISDELVKNALEIKAKENLKKLVVDATKAVGSCPGAIGGAVKLITTLTTPGAQVVAPGAAALTVISLVNCGFASKIGSDGIWNAWNFHEMKRTVPKTDINFSNTNKPEAAIRAFQTAVSTASKVATSNPIACSKTPAL